MMFTSKNLRCLQNSVKHYLLNHLLLNMQIYKLNFSTHFCSINYSYHYCTHQNLYYNIKRNLLLVYLNYFHDLLVAWTALVFSLYIQFIFFILMNSLSVFIIYKLIFSNLLPKTMMQYVFKIWLIIYLWNVKYKL